MNTGTITGFRIGRTIVALLVGIVFTAILSIGTDLGLSASGAFPPIGDVHTTPQLLVATVYRTVFGIGGYYLTATMAPSRPMLHVMALGVLGLIVSFISALTVRGLGPQWYPWALVVLALPTAWVAAKLHQVKSHAGFGRDEEKAVP